VSNVEVRFGIFADSIRSDVTRDSKRSRRSAKSRSRRLTEVRDIRERVEEIAIFDVDNFLHSKMFPSQEEDRQTGPTWKIGVRGSTLIFGPDHSHLELAYEGKRSNLSAPAVDSGGKGSTSRRPDCFCRVSA